VDIEVSKKADTLWGWYREGELKDDIWMTKRGTVTTQHISKHKELLTLENNDPKKLTKDQAWLLSPNISCFALDIKSWCR
jgi:hypothetical protein